MYWFDITWGNYEQGNGWIGMVSIEDEKLTYCPSNQMQIAAESVELMEYTGIRDKNNMEICEGDIVIYNIDGTNQKKWLNKIVYKNGCLVIENEEIPPIMDETICNIEVIGNIFENPELLESVRQP